MQSTDISVLICPRCGHVLSATNSFAVCSCMGCGRLVKTDDVKMMMSIEYGSNWKGINTIEFRTYRHTDKEWDRNYIEPEKEDWD